MFPTNHLCFLLSLPTNGAHPSEIGLFGQGGCDHHIRSPHLLEFPGQKLIWTRTLRDVSGRCGSVWNTFVYHWFSHQKISEYQELDSDIYRHPICMMMFDLQHNIQSWDCSFMTSFLRPSVKVSLGKDNFSCKEFCLLLVFQARLTQFTIVNHHESFIFAAINSVILSSSSKLQLSLAILAY